MIEIPASMTRIDVRTQADVDRMVPPALAERKRVALVCTPSEPMTVDTISTGNGYPWVFCLNPNEIAWLIVQGGDDPMNPDWVRQLRDQAVAAGVPFALEWGEWAPSCNFSDIDRAGCEIGYFGADGKFVRGVKPYEGHMVRIGRDRSGCNLDGVEWDQRPEGVQ
jgi:hypothetical protein